MTAAALKRLPEASEPADDQTPLSVANLSVAYQVDRSQIDAVSDVSFDLRRGQTTALLGESGSGKSTIVSSIVGTLPANARRSGEIRFDGTNLLTLSERRRRPFRGVHIGFVPQNPARALDPLMRIGHQLDETLKAHGVRASTAQRWERVRQLLERVGFRDPAGVAHRYPHELSGGMQQRVLIAIALTSTPRVLIADEPTSALDVTVQKAILDLIDERKSDNNTAVLLITHDIGIARERSQHIVVLKDGAIVEAGATHRVLDHPQHAYTRKLLQDVPGAGPNRRPLLARGAEPAAVSLSAVSVGYGSRGAAAQLAVDDISFDVARGSTLAVVGESGSGKTTTARTIARFIRQSAGEITVRDASGASLDGVDERQFRRHVQFVYQNPYSSLNPKHRVRTVLTEPLRALGVGDAASWARRVDELLEMVSLPREFAGRKPRELSGGQQQRLAIARALAPEPAILILDEPISALDVTVQAQILRLLEELQSRLKLTYILISHDLAVVREVADEIVVMREGKIVEHGAVEQVFLNPAHPYTRQLIEAVPAFRKGGPITALRKEG